MNCESSGLVSGARMDNSRAQENKKMSPYPGSASHPCRFGSQDGDGHERNDQNMPEGSIFRFLGAGMVR